jgi:hypothetical protein
MAFGRLAATTKLIKDHEAHFSPAGTSGGFVQAMTLIESIVFFVMFVCIWILCGRVERLEDAERCRRVHLKDPHKP